MPNCNLISNLPWQFLSVYITLLYNISVVFWTPWLQNIKLAIVYCIRPTIKQPKQFQWYHIYQSLTLALYSEALLTTRNVAYYSPHTGLSKWIITWLKLHYIPGQQGRISGEYWPSYGNHGSITDSNYDVFYITRSQSVY